MIKPLIVGVMLTLTNYGIAQNFEGFLLYKYAYLAADGKDITATMTKKKENALEQHYFINSENYAAFDENGVLMQLYNSSNNIYYFPMDGQIREMEANMEFPPRPKVETPKEKIEILNHPCSSIVFISESEKTTYYFSKEVSVNPEAFKKHRLGNWAEYLTRSNGGIALKIVTESDEYSQIIEAVEIKQMEIEDKKFNIRSYIQ